MKLKIYVVKKQQIIWGFVILAIIIVAAIVLLMMKTKQTINTFNQPNTYYTDLNNDGKTDSIFVSTDEKTSAYTVTVQTDEKKTFTLEPDSTIKSLGFFNTNWPMNLTCKDLDNDKTQEIIIQSSDEKGPILHVYKVYEDKIAKIMSGRYSIFGMIKSKDLEPIVVVGRKDRENLSYQYFTLNSNGPIPYVMPTSMNLGKLALNSLISYMETQEAETSNIEANNKILEVISKGKFLDGNLHEVKYDKYDVPSECTYMIRTEEETEIGLETTIYQVRLGLQKYDSKNPQYKILSVNKIK
ncbi:hypothetical protein ABG79_00229 [Caloramator mitchellensis]|uniref:Uncharacterized protein n=1 Tax=Caloramator mitchellensis TaxID=908809 RepID=A0A0R3K3C2_CALMK|nr:VCBS repeat-containing protein [Caloramator mitchellensis]KRQ88062.1 hypothetical protein ABG79_00229 [Caloramator mitchellensis]